jgi:hypothetical protein
MLFSNSLKDILRHHGRIKIAAEEEKADMEAWLIHKFPGRIEPVFRRIRLDIQGTGRENAPNDIETGRRQGHRIPDEGSTRQNGGQQQSA